MISNPHAVNEFSLTLANLIRLIGCFCADERQLIGLCECGLFEFVSTCNVIVTNDPRKDLPKRAQSEVATLLCEIFITLRAHVDTHSKDPIIAQYDHTKKSKKRSFETAFEQGPELVNGHIPRRVTPNKTFFLNIASHFWKTKRSCKRLFTGFESLDFARSSFFFCFTRSQPA